MMNTDFVYVGETATRAEVMEWVRSAGINLEQLDTIFLIDGEAKFSGEVAVARLLLAADGQAMIELKSEPLVSVLPDANEKEVFELFDKYNLRSLGGRATERAIPSGPLPWMTWSTRLRAKL